MHNNSLGITYNDGKILWILLARVLEANLYITLQRLIGRYLVTLEGFFVLGNVSLIKFWWNFPMIKKIRYSSSYTITNSCPKLLPRDFVAYICFNDWETSQA